MAQAARGCSAIRPESAADVGGGGSVETAMIASGYARTASRPQAIASSRSEARWLDLALAVMAVGVTVLYVLVTWLFAARKPMWNDELYTYYVAMLPTMRD